MRGLERKIAYSIGLLRRAERLALQLSPEGFYLAFSGGKDSQCVYHLAKLAGVRFRAHMQVTTIDPPELMHFVRTHYPDVILHRPPINFSKLIEKKKILPRSNVRYCCAVLKEDAGAGTVTLTGVRAAESSRRARRNEAEIFSHNAHRRKVANPDLFDLNTEKQHLCIRGQDKISVQPIFRWSDTDVWNFLRGNGIEYCRLYDEGFTRIGCIFCPMGSRRSHTLERARYPGVEQAIKRSIHKIIDEHGYMKGFQATADEVFDWWLSKEPASEFFGMLRGQTKLNL